MADFMSTPYPNDTDEYSNSVTNTTYSGDQVDGGELILRKIATVITAVGIVLNLAFIIVVARHKSMNNHINVYLVNLAVADLMVVVLACFGMYTNILSYLPSNYVGCFFIVLVTMPYYASTAIVSLVVADRYLAVCHPLRHRVVACKARSAKLVTVAWCFSIVYTCIVYLESTIETQGCQLLQGSGESYTINTQGETQTFLFSEIFKPLPVVLLLICSIVMYTRMIKLVRNQVKFRKQVNSAAVTRSEKPSQSCVRMNRMVATNTFVFFICLSPRTSLLIANYIQAAFGLKLFQHPVLTVVSTMLLFTNSCINPLIYNLTNKTYRRAFREVFFGCLSQSPASDSGKKSTVYNISK
ncbi:thyrotropin-releasing hormone receptor-like [Asterias rubens]|uniref:thyrotropin-releasing hormone receptor-like n=1 Tax=Asterias rubens TaxID=7604 RepID=UPI001454EB7A|nr:thyrotropin-releasing hormone receptor-like [Asterias rubens]